MPKQKKQKPPAFTTFDSFMRALLAVLPEATVDSDNEGQIIVYTNLSLGDWGAVSRFDSEQAHEDVA